MDLSQKQALGAIAADAALERNDFLVRATDQLRRFLEANAGRIDDVEGLVLIDDDPDYLAVAPDGSFRSRTRYRNDSGEWVSETEVIDSPSELVELYNPAEIFAAFAEAARSAAGMGEEPTGAEELMDAAGVSPAETVAEEGYAVAADEGTYAAAADAWAATNAEEPPANTDEAAARLYDLALSFQERSQDAEARLIEQFESSARPLTGRVGDLMVIDDEDERLTLTSEGRLVAEVVPEDEQDRWRRLDVAADLVEFYDPTDVFGDIADALADAFPGAIGEGGENGSDEDGDAGDGVDGGPSPA
ncbi:MAG: hypothetical protein ACLQBX_14645 [Candidatus Limnocylindrales bacterium]